MLQYVIDTTSQFLEVMPKSKRKTKGQFFTSRETAIYMANLFDFSNVAKEVKILDPGSGTGILSAALLERLEKEDKVQSIQLYCYETDKDVLPILKDNMKYMASKSSKKLSYIIIEEDYILSQQLEFNIESMLRTDFRKFDFIIGNPPYLRIMRDNPAALAMPTVVHGAPNLYFLFASMSLFNLRNNGEMVYIIPRSWTSGAYFYAFRRFFLHNGKIRRIHLFESRDKVFSIERVLQETMIIKICKTAQNSKNIIITTSEGDKDFDAITQFVVPYNTVVNGEKFYVFLPTCEKDIEVLKAINSYKNTFPSEGLCMHTGIVVDFRQRNELRKNPGKNIVPLFYSQHIKNGKVNHNPVGKEYEWIIEDKISLIQKNENYIFCKRFTAKEERRRLQCGIYSKSDFEQFKYIATHNKINFVGRIDGQAMDSDTTYGVFALLNSTLFDEYYRILNGSTQVNSTEVNSIPVPPIHLIKKIGKRLKKTEDLSTFNCDRLLKEFAYE